MEYILEANIESFSYDEEILLKNLRLNIKKGEIIILTGLSGCGKTTLLRLLNGLIPAFFKGEFKGEIKLLEKNINEYRKGELAKYIGNVFQNPKDQFFCDMVEDEIALVGENLGMEREALKVKVTQAMELLNITHLRNKSIFELSGGERQKVAIAGTLIYDTEIIFFDEPSSSLDYESIKNFSEILLKLKAVGKTIVIAEHRLYYLKDIYNRLVHIKDGTIGGIYEKGALNNAKCRKLLLRTLNERELVSEKSPVFEEKYIEVKNIDVSRGGKTLLKNLSFNMSKSEIMGVIGQNGVGKTTLAEILCGLWGDRLYISYGRRCKERIKNAYLVLQDVDGEIFLDSVENELLSCAGGDDLEKLRYYLRKSGLWEKRTAHPQKLSGGQKQRLAIITSFLSNRKIIILDEPTSGLDYQSMKLMSELIEEKSEDSAFIIITHDLELLFNTCHSVLLLNNKGYKKLPVMGNENVIFDFIDGNSIIA